MKMINYEEKGQVFWRVKGSQYDQVIYNECNKSNFACNELYFIIFSHMLSTISYKAPCFQAHWASFM